MSAELVFKIVADAEWDGVAEAYHGSADDRRDGFLHFSTGPQLMETLARHYAGRDHLLLLAVEAKSLAPKLKWEYAPSRGEDFPHLYGPLPKSAVLWIKPLRKKDGRFVLPEGVEASP